MKTNRLRLSFVATLALLSLVSCQTACTNTLAPKTVTAKHASYDGDAQTSGVLEITDTGFIVTPRWRDRYNLAIARYSASFAPALTPDHGLIARTDGTYLVNREAMTKAITMFAWLRMGKEPAK